MEKGEEWYLRTRAYICWGLSFYYGVRLAAAYGREENPPGLKGKLNRGAVRARGPDYLLFSQ